MTGLIPKLELVEAATGSGAPAGTITDRHGELDRQLRVTVLICCYPPRTCRDGKRGGDAVSVEIFGEVTLRYLLAPVARGFTERPQQPLSMTRRSNADPGYRSDSRSRSLCRWAVQYSLGLARSEGVLARGGIGRLPSFTSTSTSTSSGDRASDKKQTDHCCQWHWPHCIMVPPGPNPLPNYLVACFIVKHKAATQSNLGHGLPTSAKTRGGVAISLGTCCEQQPSV